ncbi:metallophosphoesterase family protein [bacterium]|nr:metallophosphoesterase family protein [bacterium]
MRIGVFSDVHGNLEALNEVLDALKEESVDRFICIGDVVGYGPDPNACVEKVREISDAVVAGNHDFAAAGRISTADFNENAAQAILWTQANLNPDSAHFLHELPMVFEYGDITAVHATPESPAEWHYILSENDAKRSLAASPTLICLVGHTHVPCIFVKDPEGGISLKEDHQVHFRSGEKYLINAGSVGQPRNGDTRAAYGVLDTEEGEFHFGFREYPVEKVQQKMARAGLPLWLIERLALGQ